MRVTPSSLKGTFNYMAPEAFEPPLGVEADVWSLGCVLLEMATGLTPWAGMQLQQIMMAVAVRHQVRPNPPTAAPASPRHPTAYDSNPSGALLLQL